MAAAPPTHAPGTGERTGNPPSRPSSSSTFPDRGHRRHRHDGHHGDRPLFRKAGGIQDPRQLSLRGADFNVTGRGPRRRPDQVRGDLQTSIPRSSSAADRAHGIGRLREIRHRLLDQFLPGLEGDGTVDKRHRASRRSTSGSPTSTRAARDQHLPRKWTDWCGSTSRLFMSDLDKIKYRAAQAAMAVVKQALEDPAMKTMKPELQEPVMEKVLEDHPSIQFAYVVDMNGRRRPGTSPGCGPCAVRALWRRDGPVRPGVVHPAIQTGKSHVTNFYISKLTGAVYYRVGAHRRRSGRDGGHLRSGHQVRGLGQAGRGHGRGDADRLKAEV